MLASLFILASLTTASSASIRGVNLGSWFVPEMWMVNFYDGTEFWDFCSICSWNRTEADLRMKSHLSSWINEDAFHWMSTQRINSVRLPLGYWNVIPDPYNMYVPLDLEVSDTYIRQALDWALKYNMTVLLDLHGAPGSQNGNDHSGCGSQGINWNTDYNRNLSLQAIEAMAKQYGSHPAVMGIELMNEPAYELESEAHDNMLQYYETAYQVIRSYNKDIAVVINVLYSDFYDVWDKELVSPAYTNVYYDYHLYDCFGDANQFTTEQHLADAESWGRVIAAHNAYHPVLIGEWSAATGVNPGGQAFVDAEETSFANGLGWYFWSLKLAKNKNSFEWNFESATNQHVYKI